MINALSRRLNLLNWEPIPPNLRRPLAIGGAVIIALLILTAFIAEPSEPEPVGGPPMIRRLTEEQYRNSIADIFGPEIPIAGRFERPIRAEGLVAVGTGSAGMSPFAMEQYDASAQAIAAAVTGVKGRAKYVRCGPKNGKAFDAVCAKSFVTEKGRLLFRRALSQEEIGRYTGLAQQSATKLNDFYQGLEMSLYTMLMAPDFLFRIERFVPATDGEPAKLDAYAKASRMAFFLTNAPPDDALLRAAENGDLDSNGGVADQADRLMQSPRYTGAVRSFFADMMQFDKFETLSKDPEIYPAYNSDFARDAQEQTLRTVADHLIAKGGDYRDLFTTRDTFLTRSLGVVYRTPVPARGQWMAARFSEGSMRAGIQSHISFLTLHSHPGRTSPTLRGYAVRQIFLCQDVPDPPASVNFTAVETNAHAPNVTAKDRIKAHASEPSCAGCHKVMDPLGLTLENYDGLGGYRTRENGAIIDTRGELDGPTFTTTDGLADALRNHPETPKCVAERMYKAAVGRDIMWRERYYLDWLNEGFAHDGYRIPDLMRRIVTSDNFYVITPPLAPKKGA